MIPRFFAPGTGAACRRVSWAVLTAAVITATAQAQAPIVAPDPTTSLRRFPLQIMVRRPDLGVEPVSILRLVALHPHDDILFTVDDHLKGDWTLVVANVGTGQRISVKSWNLWDKKLTRHPIDAGEIPDSDIVPLFFLVLNPHREHRVFDGIKHALETSAEQIISQTAIFTSLYQQQNRLLNFMSAYAALGPKTAPDPKSLGARVDAINLDLGATYDPNVQYTSPGQLQHGLDAGVGYLNAWRESPDNPAPAAAATQSQLPGVVSDWVGLVGDLMHIFVRPPHDVKLTFIPAAASECDPGMGVPDDWLQLVTERVLESKDDSLPTLTFRPTYERPITSRPVPLNFAKYQVLAGGKEVSIPLASECRELFLHDWAWGWESSIDGAPYSKLDGARLIPGRGLVFPINAAWWSGAPEHKVFVRARVGFQMQESKQIEVARELPQRWSLEEPNDQDLASGDPSVAIKMSRWGTAQPFYQFDSVTLKDSAGKTFPAEQVSFNNDLSARFNLAGVTPGIAHVQVRQMEADAPDEDVTLFIAPKHPVVSISCGKGDRVLRISGPEAEWVKSVKADPLTVQQTDDSESSMKKLTLSGIVPTTLKTVEVTYQKDGLQWTRPEPVSFGEPRPRVNAEVVGAVPVDFPIGAGADPTWATATLPEGWIRTRQPIRVELGAIRPFAWTHDVSLELGFGSADDVQSVVALPEGPLFAFDGSSPDAYLTLDLESAIPVTAKRNSGLLWVRLTRNGLASPWTLVNTKSDGSGAPIRAVKLPTIQSVEQVNGHTRVTFSSSDQLLGVKFAGQPGFTAPTLQDSAPTNLMSYVDGPANSTEFDLQMRDASEGVVHVKIVKR